MVAALREAVILLEPGRVRAFCPQCTSPGRVNGERRYAVFAPAFNSSSRQADSGGPETAPATPTEPTAERQIWGVWMPRYLAWFAGYGYGDVHTNVGVVPMKYPSLEQASMACADAARRGVLAVPVRVDTF